MKLEYTKLHAYEYEDENFKIMVFDGSKEAIAFPGIWVRCYVPTLPKSDDPSWSGACLYHERFESFGAAREDLKGVMLRAIEKVLEKTARREAFLRSIVVPDLEMDVM